jgi:hypothetical protein
MANAYSTPINYGQTIPTTDLAQYLGTIQHGMQQKFDVNLAKIDELISKVSAVPLARDKDKRYLGERLQNLLSVVDANSKIDLTDNVVARQITGQIASAIDDNVRTQLQNSAKINSFNQELSTIKAKKPELYNAANHGYALEQAGFNSYMNEDIDELGSLSYSPYIDVTQSMLKKVKDLKDLKGDEVIQIPDPLNPGGMRERTIKGLTKEELFQYMPNILTSEEQNQLKINGWANYKDNLVGAKAKLSEYSEKSLRNYDDEISHQQTIVDNKALSEEERAIAKSKIEATKKGKEVFSENLKSINVNKADSIGYFLELNSWKDGFSELASARVSEKYVKNDYYFEVENLKIKQEELGIKRAEALAKAGVDANGKPIVNPNSVSIAKREGALPENLDAIGALKKDYDDTYNSIVSEVKAAYDSESMPEEVKKNFKSTLAKYGYSPDGTIINEALAKGNSRASAMKVAFDSSKMGVYRPDAAKALSGLDAKRLSIATDIAVPKGEAIKETFIANPDSYVRGFTNVLKNLETPTRAAASPGIGGSATMTSSDINPKVLKEAKDFLQNNGGAKGLKQALLKDPRKIQEFNRISKAIGGAGANLESDSKKVANEKLSKNTEKGRTAYFNTFQIANITDEKAREIIISKIPQTESGQIFDSKKPLSFYKNEDGSVTITQNAGLGENKEGIWAKARPEVRVDKEDDLYKDLMNYVDINESNRGLDASRTKIKIKPETTPSFNSSNNEIILSKVAESIKTLSPDVTSQFVAPPANFVTKKDTKNVFLATLAGDIPKADIEAFVEKLPSKLKDFDVELKPMDGVWAVNIETKNGLLIKEYSTKSQFLQQDMAYLVNHHPEIIISNALLVYLKDNPEKINTILK